MNEIIDNDVFFTPVSYNKIDCILSEFNYKKDKINSFSENFILEISEVSDYFGKFYAKNNNGNYPPSISYLTEKDGAIKALEAEYWGKVVNLTGVLDIMPEKRRSELNEQIRQYQTIEFNRDNIEATILTLLSDREKYFAERVDGLFRALSGNHVTNQPEGFSKRMILEHVNDRYVSYWSCDKKGYLHDLRVIVRKFAGLPSDSEYNTTNGLIRAANRIIGQWMSIDGGHIRLRVYKKGTAHVEINPEMAWKLNQVLSHLHPTAIPPKFREKPKKQAKEFKLMGKPLPSEVIIFLAQRTRISHNFVEFKNYGVNKYIIDEAVEVLKQIGGVKTESADTQNNNWVTYSFGYQIETIIDEIIKTGEIPNYKSYQFYPTPESIAEKVIELAQIGENDNCLEPSAGIGGISDFMPKDRTLCVEISGLHSKILREKGFSVVNGDFIELAEKTNKRFDRIVMNPPYSEGRWQAHIESASKLLNKNGKLVAVLPASAKGKELIKGFKHTYSDIYDNEFKNTTISIVIVVIE